MSINGIEGIMNDNGFQALNIETLRDAFRTLNEHIRGRENTTVISDRKTRLNPPSDNDAKRIIPPDQQHKLLQDARSLPHVKTGSFRINDVVIPVDPSQETFVDIVNKINASSAGVLAAYDPDTNRFTITAQSKDGVITIYDDTSNLLTELNIKQGHYRQSTDGPYFSQSYGQRNAADIYSALVDSNEKANAFFHDERVQHEIKELLEADLVAAYQDTMVMHPQEERLVSSWTQVYNRHADSAQALEMSRNTIFNHLNGDTRAVVSFLSGDKNNEGFIKRAIRDLEAYSEKISTENDHDADAASDQQQSVLVLQPEQPENQTMDTMASAIKHIYNENNAALNKTDTAAHALVKQLSSHMQESAHDFITLVKTIDMLADSNRTAAESSTFTTDGLGREYDPFQVLTGAVKVNGSIVNVLL